MLSEKFYHRLALAMHRTVPELLATTTSMELTKWAAFYIHEPWGNEWAAFAKLAAWVAASAGHKDPDAVERSFPPVRYEPPITEEDFDAVPQMSDEEIRAQLMKLGPDLFRPTG